MDRKVIFYLGLVFFLTKTVLAVFLLSKYLDVSALPRFMSEKIVYATIGLIDSVIAVWLLKYATKEFKGIRNGLTLLIIANVSIAAVVFFEIRSNASKGIITLLISSWGEGILFYCFNLVGAVAYCVLGARMSDKQAEVMNGWQKLFQGCLMAYGILTIIYFVDILRLTFLLAIQLIGVLWIFNAYIKQGSWRILSNGKVRAVFLSTLGLPVAAAFIYYLTPILTNMDAAMEMLEEVAEVVSETEITSVKEVSGDTPSSLGFVPKNYVEKFNRVVVSDAWLSPSKKWWGVSGKELYTTVDWEAWEKQYEFREPVSSIRFSSDGAHGWANSGYQGIQLTHDGGNTWHRVSVIEVYEQLNKKEYRAGLFDNDSVIYINPETGHGGFTLKCGYFHTKNFGRSWSQKRLKNNKGNKVCLSDSPFAMNSDLSLAVSSSLGSESIYQLNKPGEYWEPLCGIDAETFLLGHEFCGDKEDLTKKQREYIKLLDNQYALLEENKYPSELFSMLIDDAYYPTDELTTPASRTGNSQFLSSMGNVITTDNQGESWAFLQSRFEFKKVIPVDAQRAYAWGEDSLWVSEDIGQVWKRFDVSSEKVRDMKYNPADRSIWLLTANRLVSVDVQKQAIRYTLDLPSIKYQKIGRSLDGKSLWIFSESDRYAKVSFDAGKNWLDLRMGLGVSEYGDLETQSMASLYCESALVGCHVLRDDGAIDIYTIDRGNNKMILSQSLKMSEDVSESADNYSVLGLVVSDGGKQIAYVLAGGNDGYVSIDAGASWSRVAFFASGERYELSYSEDGKTLFALGDDFLVYSRDLGLNWAIFNPGDDWYGYSMRYCSSADASQIYVYSESSIAHSGNAGETWQRNEYLGDLGYYCGFINNNLWIKYNRVHTYQPGQGQ